MKIALCLSGQPRCVKEGYEYYKKNLLDHYDVDVFCHVWDTDGAEHIAAYKPVTLMIEKPPTNDLSKYTRVPPPQPNWKVKNPAKSVWNLTYSLMNTIGYNLFLVHYISLDYFVSYQTYYSHLRAFDM